MTVQGGSSSSTKRGRRKKSLSEGHIRQVEKLSAVLTKAQIADFLGMSERTFRNRRQEDARIDAAYKKGRAKALSKVGASLLARALEGNVTAAIFYLKTQGGWKEARDEPRDDVYERAEAIRAAMAELDAATMGEELREVGLT